MRRMFLMLVCLLMAVGGAVQAAEVPLSSQTRSCIGCHESVTPGIVWDWRTSRHSRTTPAEALGKKEVERRISTEQVDEALANNAVGCFECHGRNTDKHADNFNHYGYSINVVISPGDCAACHPVEVKQYDVSKKAHAVGNLEKNPVYHTLVKTLIGMKEVDDLTIKTLEPTDFTKQEACFGCHGTKVEVRGMKTVSTAFGDIQVPDLANWPNQGVGRINPDGTRGACTSCHPRHGFSIEMARKPYTCSQCHLEPDVPAWDVYDESKHGDMYFSLHREWDFQAVPWKVGQDFTAPTCAACHVSLLSKPDGTVLVERSHDFASRLWVRLFGLIYSHPQPKHGDTSVIRNADGRSMPTTFSGQYASEFLIDKDEQAVRKGKMQAVCKGCHNTDWVEAHFRKLDNTLMETDKMTLQATKLMMTAWDEGLADKSNPFDEALEQKWIKQWLFYGNTARYSSAMTGAPDYVSFKYGWWGLTTNLQEMKDKIKVMRKLKGIKAEHDGDDDEKEGR